MTLLFFLRSHWQNQDTTRTVRPDLFDEPELEPYVKRSKGTLKELARDVLERNTRLRKDEEDLILLFMHDFDNFDD